MATLTRLFFLVALFAAPSSYAGDAEDLAALLNEFLGAVTEAATHDRFWAEDLVYTSSNGTRFGKAEIMQGFEESNDASDEPGPAYSAKDVRIKVYGDAAVVAFKLVATPPGDTAVQHYLNTGTFVRRDGRWRAVAWQATKVPPAE